MVLQANERARRFYEARGFRAIRFTDGAEAIWHSLADLTSFARSQSIIAEATRVLIPTPPRRSIKAEWEAAAQMLLNLAGKDQTMSPHKTREEFSEILRIGWEQAGYPVADSDEKFLRLLRLCYTQPRDPRGPAPECTVWHDNKDCFVHQMTLINWLSTPSGRHHHYEWGEVRDALFLLNFVPLQVHRSVNKEHAKVRLWRGPLEILVADETGE